MKKILLIVGIILIFACVLALLFAALKWYGYRHLVDGTADHYTRLHRKMISYFVTGIVLAAAGTACIILRAKI